MADSWTVSSEDYCKMFESKIIKVIQDWTDLTSEKGNKDQTAKLFSETIQLILCGAWKKTKSEVQAQLNLVLQQSLNCEIMIEPESKKQIETLANIMADPWGSTVLQEILNSDSDVQEQKALEFINSETPEVIRSRIEVLEETNCQDFALRLCTWCLRSDNLENEPWLQKKYIKLLYQQGHIAKLSEEICKLSCDSGLELVDEILQTKDTDLCAINIAECLVQILLVRDLIQPSECCCSKRLMESWLNIHELQRVDVKKIQEEALKLCSLSTTSAHIYLMIDLLYNKFGDALLKTHLRLFIHALTVDLNFLENARLNDSFEEVSQLETHVANMLYKLAMLLENYPEIAKECHLTAFSVDPSTERLATLEKLAHLLDVYENAASVPLGVPLVPCSGECHCREKGECRRILSDKYSVTEPSNSIADVNNSSSINRETVETCSTKSISLKNTDSIEVNISKDSKLLPNPKHCNSDDSLCSVSSKLSSSTESGFSNNCNGLNVKSQVSKELSCDITSHQFDNQTDNEPLPNFMLLSENEQFTSPVHKHWEESNTPICNIRSPSQHSKDNDNTSKSENNLPPTTTSDVNPKSSLGVYPQYSGTDDIYSVSSGILDCRIDGVTKEMLKDLTIVLDEPRRKTLTWNSAWPELKQRCEEHLFIKLALKASSSVYSWKKKDTFTSEVLSDDENSGSDDLILQQANELIQGDIPKLFSSDSENDATSELSADEDDDSATSNYDYKSYYATCNMNPKVVLTRTEVERNFKYKEIGSKKLLPNETSPSTKDSENHEDSSLIISTSTTANQEQLSQSPVSLEEIPAISDYIENQSVTAENTEQLTSSPTSIPTVPPNSAAAVLQVMNPVQHLYESQETFSVSSQNINNSYPVEEAKTENLLLHQSNAVSIGNQYHVQAVTLPTHVHSLGINSASTLSSTETVEDKNLNTQVCPAEDAKELSLSDKSEMLNLLLSDSLPVVNCKPFIPNLQLGNLLHSGSQVFPTDKNVQTSSVDSLIQVTSIKTPICSTSTNDLLSSNEIQLPPSEINKSDDTANEQPFGNDLNLQQDGLILAMESSCDDRSFNSSAAIHLEPKIPPNLLNEQSEAILNNAFDPNRPESNVLLNDLENTPIKDAITNLIIDKGVATGVTPVGSANHPSPVFPAAANTMTCAYLVQTVQSNSSSQTDTEQNQLKQSNETTVSQLLTPTVRLSGITSNLPIEQEKLINSMRVSSHNVQSETSVPSNNHFSNKDVASVPTDGVVVQNSSAVNNFASPCNGQAFLITVTVPVSNCMTAQDSCKGAADLNTARVFTNSECGPNSANLLSKSFEDSKSESGCSNSSTESVYNQGASSQQTEKPIQTKSSDFQDNYKQFLLGRAIDKKKLISDDKKMVKETTAARISQQPSFHQKLQHLNKQTIVKEQVENNIYQQQKGIELPNKIQIQEGPGLPTLQRQLIPLPHSQLSVQVATSGPQKTSSVAPCIAKPLPQVNLVAAKGKTYFQPKNISASNVSHNMLTVSNVMVPPRVSSAPPLPRAASPLLQTILETANRTIEDGSPGNDKKKLFTGKGDRRKWVSVRNQHGIMEYKKVENQVNNRIIQGYLQALPIPSFSAHNHTNANVSLCSQTLSLSSSTTQMTPTMVTFVQAPIASCSQLTLENCSKMQINKFDSHINFINPISQPSEKGQETCKTTSATALPVVSAMENISYVQRVVNNIIGKPSPKKKVDKLAADSCGGLNTELGEDNKLLKKKKSSPKKKPEQTIDGKPLKSSENPKHYCEKCEKYLCSTFSLRRHLQSVHKIITQETPKISETPKSLKSKKKPTVNKAETDGPSKSKFDTTDCNNEEIMKQVQAIMDQVKNASNLKPSPYQKNSDNSKSDKNAKQYLEHRLSENVPAETIVCEKIDASEADNQLVDNTSISAIETELDNIKNCSEKISDLLRKDSVVENENFEETTSGDCTTESAEMKKIVLLKQNNDDALLYNKVNLLPCNSELSKKEKDTEDLKEQISDFKEENDTTKEQLSESNEQVSDVKEEISNLKGQLSDEQPNNNCENSLPSKENSCENSCHESEVIQIAEDENLPRKRSRTKEKVKDVDDTSTEGSTDGATPIKVRTRARNSKPPSKRCCSCCEEKVDPSGKRCRTDKRSSKTLRGPSKRLKDTKRSADCPRTRSAVRR